jgi:hypothetical protein
MIKQWIGVALIASCLGLATEAKAQCGPGCDDCCSGNVKMVPGPLRSELAPTVPACDCDLSLPANIPNAFDRDCHGRPDYHCDGMWFSAEYLIWWFRDPRLPAPLVTSSVLGANGFPVSNGALGVPGTVILLDKNGLDYPAFSGGRLNAGFWLTPDRTLSVEGTGFVTEQGGTIRSFRSDAAGNPLITIPLFSVTSVNPFAGFENTIPYAFRGNATGAVSVHADSRLWDAEANLVFIGTPRSPWAFFVGFRYADFRETIDIDGETSPLPTSNILIDNTDHFETRNQFYGGQIGLRVGGPLFGLFVAAQAKAAIGNNQETLLIGGSTTTLPGPVTVPGGIFTALSNIGRFTHDQFAVIPEAEVKVGYPINRYLMAFVGYNLFYWDGVLRPGDQIDRRVGPTAIGPFPMVLPFHQNSFLAHGINAGLEMRY